MTDIREDWKARQSEMMAKDVAAVDQEQLKGVIEAIRRYEAGDCITDAVMRVNGGWLMGEAWDLCLASLVQRGILRASGVGIWRIDWLRIERYERKESAAVAVEPAKKAGQGSLF